MPGDISRPYVSSPGRIFPLPFGLTTADSLYHHPRETRITDMDFPSDRPGVPVPPSPTPTALHDKLRDLSFPLSPLVQITTGYIHPAFPRMVLNYYLLTSDELDSLMEFYHQKGNSEHMLKYPLPVGWEEDMDLEQKRTRFGRFIGLRGCEGPVRESFGDSSFFGKKLGPLPIEIPRKRDWDY